MHTRYFVDIACGVLGIGMRSTIPGFAYGGRVVSHRGLQVQQEAFSGIQSKSIQFFAESDDQIGLISQPGVNNPHEIRESHTTPSTIISEDERGYVVVTGYGENETSGESPRHAKEETAVHHGLNGGHANDWLERLKSAVFCGIAASGAFCILVFSFGYSCQRLKGRLADSGETNIIRGFLNNMPHVGKHSEAFQSVEGGGENLAERYRYDARSIAGDMRSSMERLLKDRLRRSDRIGYPARIPRKSIADIFDLGPVVLTGKDKRIPVLQPAQNVIRTRVLLRDSHGECLRQEGGEIIGSPDDSIHARQVKPLYPANTSRRYKMC